MIARSTEYKLVDGVTHVILAEGSAAAMQQRRKAARKTGQPVYVGLAPGKRVGEKFCGS